MRLYYAYDLISDTAYFFQSLFSVDFYYNQREELAAEGRVGDFYDILKRLGALYKIPLVLQRNIEIRSSTSLILDAAKILNPFDPTQDLVNILSTIGGLDIANMTSTLLDTPIRVTLNLLDGVERFVTVEVFSEQQYTYCENSYKITLDINTFQDTDYSLYSLGRKPDLFARMVIHDGTPFQIESPKDQNNYDYYVTFKSANGFKDAIIPLCHGQRIELSILDEDWLIDDELLYFEFDFDSDFPNRLFKSFSAGKFLAAQVEISFERP
jgi:hypothetical protein